MTQHYAGTKLITAWEQEKDGQPGYAVKYEDGYTSWSPKEAFEKAYVAIGHVGSISAELQELRGQIMLNQTRFEKLAEILRGIETDHDERKLVHAEYAALDNLIDAQVRRLGHFVTGTQGEDSVIAFKVREPKTEADANDPA